MTPLTNNPLKDKLAKAATAKDPSQLNNFADKNAWTESKLLKMYNSSTWGRLKPETKEYILGQVYDQYVAQNYISSGLPPMSREDWITGAAHPDGTVIPEGNYRSKWEDFATQTSVSGVHGASVLTGEGINFGHRMWNKLYTSVWNDDLPPDGVPWPNTQQSWHAGMNEYIGGWFNRAANWSQEGVGRSAYVLGTHPSQSWYGTVGGSVGNFAGQLPYYVALGEAVVATGGLALGGLGLTGEALAGTSGAVDAALGRGMVATAKYANNLTEALNATRTGRLVATTFKGATEGYLAATIKGEPQEERWKEAVDWGLTNAVFGLVGANASDLIQRYKLDAKTKQFLGTVVRMGGKALGYTLFESGIRRAFNNHIPIDIMPDYMGRLAPRAPDMDWHDIHDRPEGPEAPSVTPPPPLKTYTELENEPVPFTVPPGAPVGTTPMGAYLDHLQTRGPNDPYPPIDSIEGENPAESLAWDKSVYPIREHTHNGVTYQSRYIHRGYGVLVRAVDSQGRIIAKVKLNQSYVDPNDIQSHWPWVQPAERGSGFAREMYTQIPAIAKSYGFTGWRSEGTRTEYGEGLWRGLFLRGFAEEAGTPQYTLIDRRTGQRYIKPGYYRFKWADHVHDKHGAPPEQVIPNTGPDMQFSWRPRSRVDVEEHIRQSTSSVRYDPDTGEYKYEPGKPSMEELAGGRGIYDAPHPNFPNMGHLVYRNKYYPYTNLREMAIRHQLLVERAENELRQYDPIRAGLSESAEQMLRTIARQEFGRGDISRFSNVMLRTLYARFSEHLNEVSEQIPQLSPQEVLRENQGKVQAQSQSNPVYAQFAQRAKTELGIDTAQASTEHQIEQNKLQTAPPLRQRLRDLWRRATGTSGEPHPFAQQLEEEYHGKPEEVIRTDDYEPPEGATASLRGLTPDVRRLMRVQRLANIERVRNARTRSRRFLTDVGAREQRLSPNRTASDDTLVGRRDRRTYAERLAAEVTDDFIKSLERSLLLNPDDHPSASGVSFEKPLSRFLFHWGDRAHLPEPIVTKLAREIRKPVTGIGRFVSYAEIDKASELVARDLIQLAKIGHTRSDGRIHIFKSSEFFGGRSVWQSNLVGEVENNEKQLMGHILANHPEALATMEMVLDALHPKRAAAYNMEEWVKYNNIIDDAMRGIITPQGNPIIREAIAAQRGADTATAVTTPEPEPTPAAQPAARTRNRQRRVIPPGMTIQRGPNFESEGIYHVNYSGVTRRIYRDMSQGVGSGWWHDADISDHTRSLLGFTQQEAINRIQADIEHPPANAPTRRATPTAQPAATPQATPRRTRPPQPRRWPGGAVSVRGPSFDTDGIYHVTTGNFVRRIHLDVRDNVWRDVDVADDMHSFLGLTMREAIAQVVAEHRNLTIPPRN